MKIDKFVLFCFLLSSIIFISCIYFADNKLDKLQEINNKLERDVDNYKKNWKPIEHGVALTPKEIQRLRELCRCK
jgi:hypothetical protein